MPMTKPFLKVDFRIHELRKRVESDSQPHAHLKTAFPVKPLLMIGNNSSLLDCAAPKLVVICSIATVFN